MYIAVRLTNTWSLPVSESEWYDPLYILAYRRL